MNIFKKLISFIKKIFVKKPTEPEIENIDEPFKLDVSSLEFGDIIWAERYDTEEERLGMGEGHDRGPFVFLGLDNDELIGMYCTSKPKVSSIQICEDYYGFGHKETYVVPNYIKNLKEEAIYGVDSDCLNLFDKNRIKKKMVLNHSEHAECALENVDYKPSYEIGDVVTFNFKNYVIIGIHENKCTLLQITGFYPVKSDVDFNTVTFKYADTITLPCEKLLYVNTLPYNDMKKIMTDYIAYVNDKTVRTTRLEVGDVVRCDDKTFYVYSTSGNKADSFKIERRNAYNSITIDNLKYVPFYGTKKRIDMEQDKYKNERSASLREIHNIQKSRNVYKKAYKLARRENRILGQTIQNPELGLIVINRYDMLKRYIVVGTNIENNTYRVASVDEILLNRSLVFSDLPIKDVKETYELSPSEYDKAIKILHGKYNSEAYDALKSKSH